MMSCVQTRRLLSAGVLAVCLPGAALAEEQPTHYAAEPSETLEQAITNFVTYTARVQDVLARDPLTPGDMEEVHEMTYTLEVALARMNAELAALPDILEMLHKTSEGDDPEAMKAAGAAFLGIAQAFQAP